MNRRHTIGGGVRSVSSVLPIVGIKGRASGLCVRCVDDKRPAIEPGTEPVWNAAGGEDDGPFVGPMALGRHADDGSSEIPHLQFRSKPPEAHAPQAPQPQVEGDAELAPRTLPREAGADSLDRRELCDRGQVQTIDEGDCLIHGSHPA
jgi:hypothetical protein